MSRSASLISIVAATIIALVVFVAIPGHTAKESGDALSLTVALEMLWASTTKACRPS